MGKDVKDTKDVSSRIENVSKNIAGESSDIKMAGRKDLMTERPIERYHDLLNATDDYQRIKYATVYLSSFEFQQWSGRFEDSVDREEKFRGDALRAMFPDFAGFINRRYDVRALPETPFEPVWKMLGSVGAQLDEIDPDQRAAALANDIEPASFYSMIVDGLSYYGNARQGESIPKRARYVLEFADEAVTLLQFRHNYLLAIMMTRLSNFSTDLLNETRAYISGPILEVVQNGQVQMTNLEDYGIGELEKVIQTRADLQKLGCKVDPNPWIGRSFALAKMNVQPGPQFSAAENSALIRFKKLLDELQPEYNLPSDWLGDTKYSRHSVDCSFPYTKHASH